ncbi:hypothetical protein [Bradymonas sediminis]|uniref:Uncharacterized protein n=1 Tax=Bradymonas sediminis TaxID=1548548 RepID=A0A2Z4FLI1_9DELT|nr:hypothetical protein [Bradymonas sediminis]AWV89782.1 hypothetical protein DN745_10715 [Bradymonas sediminis]TDP76471.1 hypothetical protein DFR33_102100 [Bradymonas sediminis]
MSGFRQIFSALGPRPAIIAGAMVASTLVAQAPAFAGDEPEGGDRGVQRGVAAEVSYDSIGGDGFLGLRLKLEYAFEMPQFGCDEGVDPTCRTDLRLGLQAPLRLRVYDAEPRQDSVFRDEDWDEVSDFLRVLKTLEYGEKGGALHLHAGELGPISLGHGTIVGDYHNVITTDHYQMGAAGELNTLYGGAEVLLDNIIDPGVMGARAYVYPWAFVAADSALSRVGVGFCVAADIQAPTELASDADDALIVDDARNPVVLREQSTTLIGVDLEVALVDSEQFSLIPYADFAKHTSLGSGVFAGAFLSAKLSDSYEVFSKLEYRRIGERFLPTYIGPVYEIERLQFAGWGQQLPAPKVRVAASLSGEAAQGFYGSLGLRVRDKLTLSAAWADHEGPMNQLFHLRATARPTEKIQVGLYFHKQYFDAFSDVFDLDGALVAAESRVSVWGPFYALGRYGRMWQIAPDGLYESVNDWSLGAGASMGF